jgi:hypothetical protein
LGSIWEANSAIFDPLLGIAARQDGKTVLHGIAAFNVLATPSGRSEPSKWGYYWEAARREKGI